MKAYSIYQLYHETLPKDVIEIKGWVRNNRQSKTMAFVHINDGSDFRNLQVVCDHERVDASIIADANIGSAVICRGKIVATPDGQQPFEMQVEDFDLVCGVPEKYPLQNKRHSFEFLRTVADLRPRSYTFSAVYRVRSGLSYAVHRFFHERRFVQVHTPVLTASDAEGAGEMFTVTNFNLQNIPRNDDGGVDYSSDFFGQCAHLAVSGQLNAEAFALAYKNVYSFGPTFRAEDSNTTRHAAEFWMIEPEIAFADLNDDIELAEAFIRDMIHSVLSEYPNEMDFFNERIEKGLIERLEKLQKADFARITYGEAVKMLQDSKASFEYPMSWGVDLQTEHEKFITDEIIGGPVFVTDYPKDIKAFYMRENDDGKTVAAVDLLVPGIGEILGGSQREERYDVLKEKLQRLHFNMQDYEWYLNLRLNGGTKHAGFGIGFERLLMYLTGMKNIRDVIAFPRVPGQITF